MTNGDGRYVKKYGNHVYWMIRCPCHPNADSKGYVKEHRLVVEILTGRFLSKREHVHHIDGIGLNNVPENLQLVTQREHGQLHKYWLTSPRRDNTWAKKSYNGGPCKKSDCKRTASANGYCHNHNRDLWRQKRKGANLAYS